MRPVLFVYSMKVIDSKIIDSGYDKFETLRILEWNLAYAAVRGLSENSSREQIFDYSLGKRMDRATVLGAALAIKEYIQANFGDEERIGIALPSCIPGILVNLAVQMAGKVSVNLNFTLGPESAAACLRKAGIRTVIGSNKVKEKVLQHYSDYPWGDRFIDVGDMLKRIGKKRIVPKVIAVKLLPWRMTAAIFGIPKYGGNKEASIIFTSGSEGEPKAAVLTHRNIIANCVQMSQIGIVWPGDATLHANLPLFHSFGQSIQVWFCSIFGVRQVAVQSPLEVQSNLDAIREGGSTLMISTPTFLRSYYKKATPADLGKLQYVIGGAEKTPDGFIEAWEGKFPSVRYLAGYGLTEASPVVAVNLPEGLKRGKMCPQPSSSKSESVGEIFPGLQAAVVSPETGERLNIGETGILQLRGASIFPGYLNMPEVNRERIVDGWLNTGDLASLDSDGFIFIKGRLSRFSKIGGEMVPHTGIEEAVERALNIENSDEPKIAVGSKIDPAKGEVLVLLAAMDIDMTALRKALMKAGQPNLWIPRKMMRVEKIPLLATGKLDLGKIRKICMAAD